MLVVLLWNRWFLWHFVLLIEDRRSNQRFVRHRCSLIAVKCLSFFEIIIASLDLLRLLPYETLERRVERERKINPKIIRIISSRMKIVKYP